MYSTEGYRRNSPDRNNPYNIIPSGNISMKGVDHPVLGIDEYGNMQWMIPGEEYQFKGNNVLEIPYMQGGGGKNASGRTAGATKPLPEDYQQFLEFNTTAPKNRQPKENYQYGNPRDYDYYGMWDALGKPTNFEQALQMNPDWQPDPYDGTYHGFSTNSNTEVWLKSHIPGEKEPGSTAWMEYQGFALSPQEWGIKNNNLVYDPELQRMRYLPKQQQGGQVMELDDNEIENYRRQGYIVEEINEFENGGPFNTYKKYVQQAKNQAVPTTSKTKYSQQELIEQPLWLQGDDNLENKIPIAENVRNDSQLNTAKTNFNLEKFTEAVNISNKQNLEKSINNLDFSQSLALDDKFSYHNRYVPGDPFKTPRKVKEPLETQNTTPATNPVYTVKSGDSLNKIALDNNTTLAEVLKLNPQITNPNAINIGQSVKLPMPKVATQPSTTNNKYIVKSGDNFSAIAQKNNTTVAELTKLNPQIKNINNIQIGDVINYPKAVETEETMQYYSKDYLKKRNEYINKLPNEDKIKTINHTNNYAIVDKKNHKISVYDKNNRLLTEQPIATGLNETDYNTITYVDANGNIISNAGNMSTPAGITQITSKGSYHGMPSFTRGRPKYDKDRNVTYEDIASSMHYGPNCGSNGCVRLPDNTSTKLDPYLEKGTMVYVLPQDETKATFKVNNNAVSFVTTKGKSNEYDPTQHIPKNGRSQKNWYQYNTFVDKSYAPIKIAYEGDIYKSTENNKSGFNKIKDDALDVIVDKAKLNPLTKFKDVYRDNYINSLVQNKEKIQKSVGVSSELYDDLTTLALGLAEQETKFGTADSYYAKKLLNVGSNLVTGNDPGDWHKGTGISKIKEVTGNNSVNSIGATQVKMTADNPEYQELYASLDLTPENVQADIGKSAELTMARLLKMYMDEVYGKEYYDADGNRMSDQDVLLYKWMGKNDELVNGTATPEKNIYLNNVKGYSNNFTIYQGVSNNNTSNTFREGGAYEELELTDEEILEYTRRGYRIEEIK